MAEDEADRPGLPIEELLPDPPHTAPAHGVPERDDDFGNPQGIPQGGPYKPLPDFLDSESVEPPVVRGDTR